MSQVLLFRPTAADGRMRMGAVAADERLTTNANDLLLQNAAARFARSYLPSFVGRRGS